MRLDTLQKLRKLYILSSVAVALVLLVVSAFVAQTLHQSRQRYYDNAEETSRNLAISLENFLRAYFQEVDLALRRAGGEFLAMHKERRFDDERFSAYLRSLKERIPHARSIRGSDRDGRVIYGEDIDPAHLQDLSIREFFARVKTERTLVFGVPVKSRISGEWVLPLVFPLTLPDGAFGGSAYINLNNTTINELFSSLRLGPNGVITLLDDRRRILHRYPFNDGVVIGSPINLSPQTTAVLNSERRRATYTSVSLRDGQQRVLSIERIGDYPVYVLVGMASADFLAPWREEVRNDVIFLALLYALAGAALAAVRLTLRRQYQGFTQLLEKDQALQGSLARLTQSESRWRSLTEGLPQMVWTITPPALRLDFLSHHWHDYTGVPVARLLGGAIWLGILHPDDRAGVEAEWARALAAGAQFRCDCRLRRADGAWRVFDHHALPQRDAGGAIVCWVGSSTDMTETREAHAALTAATDAALAAGRAKSDFVANMSHEIRTPMNAVLGMLQLLQQTALGVRQRDYAAKAETAARALLGLLNDILDFSKVEAGKLVLERQPFSVEQLLRDLAVILSANVGAKQVEVLFQIDPDLPRWLCGDALRLQQVLLNLSGNAIKFTDRGDVVLSARLAARDADGLHVAFAVRDTGIGISAEQCLRIFDGFSQAEASTARRYGGSGLGLAISRRLVQLMGGALRVDSAEGRGSVFNFSAVFQPAEAPPAPAGQTERAINPAQLRDLDCLVVDDNASALTVLREMALSLGWRVETADNGRAALAAVAGRGAERPYDVVLIDWRMPQLDGWETSRQIRQLLQPPARTPLIIMVTAHDRELLAQRQAQHAPVLDGMLVKPVTASMLFDAVADATLGARTGAFAMTSAPAPSQMRLAGMRLLLVEDNPTNQQVARELLANEGARVDLASGGREAVDALLRAAAPPQLVLMDIQMPDMDGYAATAAIRAQLGLLAPPIVAMTANAMPSDRQAALAAGMVDHVGKPFDLAQLIDVILRHTRRGDAAAAPEKITEAAPPPPAGPASAAPAQLLNGAAALKRMGGLMQVYLGALRGFIGEAAALAATLRALQPPHDRGAIESTLHLLKGLAGTVGAERLYGLAARAERSARQGDAGADVDGDGDGDDGGSHRLRHDIDQLLAAVPQTVDAVALLVRQLEAAAATGAPPSA
ncbi:response regulator [Rugamonas sp.]|uniref:response regulator n=1 Tax=Rugamonas sp. TaxID=1926287 RepID=UPI0025D74376|nr:response regulator [Rugamonas sp.]